MGTLAVALYGDLTLLNTGLTRLEQLVVQGLGVIVAAIWSFMVMWLVAGTLHQLSSLRVSQAEERQGLNAAEQDAVPNYSDFPDELVEQWFRDLRVEGGNQRALATNVPWQPMVKGQRPLPGTTCVLCRTSVAPPAHNCTCCANYKYSVDVSFWVLFNQRSDARKLRLCPLFGAISQD